MVAHWRRNGDIPEWCEEDVSCVSVREERVREEESEGGG